MSIQVACAACGAKYSVKTELAGKTAKCKCGAKIKLPASVPAPDPIMPELFGSLFDELPSPTETSSKTSPAAKRKDSHVAASQEQINEVARKATAWWTGTSELRGVGKLFEGTGPAVLKIGAGALVCGLVAFKFTMQGEEQTKMEPGMQLPFVLGTAVVGGLVASLLVVADFVRSRRAAGRHVPLFLRMFFGGRWLSLFLWIITVFVVVTAGALLLAFLEGP